MKLRGFTLIESILVITIILLLVGMASLSLGSVFQIGEEKRIENELALLLLASKAYHLAYPEKTSIKQEELIANGFLKEKIQNHKNYHYKINLENEKVIVFLESDSGIYQYRNGCYAKESY